MLTFLYILIVFFLVLANGFFVASEFALVGVRRSRIMMLVESGNRRAPLLLEMIDHLNAYISATQLGITMASLALGWVGEPVFAHLLEAPLEGLVSDTVRHTIAFAVAFFIITFLHIVLGELAPKTLALERAEKTALAIALPLRLFYKAFRLPIRLLDWAGIRTVRLFGLHPSGEHGSVYTEEELRQLIDIAHTSGHVEADERKLINRVFEFSDAEVREAMIPRTEVSALPVTANLEETKQAFRTLGYSRLPVFRDHLDNIVGVVFRRDLEPFLEHPQTEFDLRNLAHPPMYIPDGQRLGTALKQMQAARTHLAFVVDEFGGIDGLITLEDLLEEIVGEINDEYDDEVRSQISEDNGTYLLDGMLAVRDLNRKLNLELPEQSHYTTIAGFLIAQAGRLMRAGDAVEYEGAQFRVEQVEGKRIRLIRFIPRAANQFKIAVFSILNMALL
jgi:CBS domain containing-hemolysin-like protein